MERREEDRYETELLVHLATIDFVANVTAGAYLLNCAKEGAFLVSPLYFKEGTRLSIKIDMLGGPFEIYADVMNCQQDDVEKFRFEKTFGLRVQFVDFTEEDWKQLLKAMGRS